MEWYWLAIATFCVGYWLFWRVRAVWKWYHNPARFLGRQALSMGWTSLGVVRNLVGDKFLHVQKGEMEASISFDSHRIVLVEPAIERTFKDFVELEQWLQLTKNESSSVH